MTQEPTRRMDTFGPDSMALPELKLVQNVGGDEAKGFGAEPGDLFCTLTDEIIKGEEGLDIIVVDMQKTRTYWGRSEIGEEPPECASMDADSHQSLDGQNCKGCPYRCETPWSVDAAKRRELCLVNYNILAINLGSSMPILIRASGISTKPVRELLTQLRLNRTLKGEYHRAVVKVTSQKKKTESGEAFAYNFKLAGLLEEPDKVEEMKALSMSLLGTQILLPEGREPEPEPALPKEKAQSGKAPVTKQPQPAKTNEPVILDTDF